MENNLFINGNLDRIAANRVVLCISSEFGIRTGVSPDDEQYNEIIRSAQNHNCIAIMPKTKKKPFKENYAKRFDSKKGSNNNAPEE